jgi:hypothetical protein
MASFRFYNKNGFSFRVFLMRITVLGKISRFSERKKNGMAPLAYSGSGWERELFMYV